MNATTYAKYVPAINAFLNPQADSTRKTWDNVVEIFFEMNTDASFASKADLAYTFENVSRPNYFRIHGSKLEQYFDTLKFSEAAMVNEGLQKNIDFVYDNDKLRLSFSALRRLVYTKGDDALIESFDFIDKVYQNYHRYELAMMNKSKRPTHWTLVERISNYTTTMQPHIDHAFEKGTSKKTEASFRTMDSQPIVYCVIKGTYKSISAKLAKYKKYVEEYNATGKLRKKKNSNEDEPILYSDEQIVPIYESVLPNVEDEIDAVIGYINDNYALPYRVRQQEEYKGDKKLSLTKTKHCIKMTKSCFLINEDQEDYNQDMLPDDIKTVRWMLRNGNKVYSKEGERKKFVKKEKVKKGEIVTPNYVDIDTFYETDGQFLDQKNSVPLAVRGDSNVSLVVDVDEPAFINNFDIGDENQNLEDQDDPEENNDDDANETDQDSGNISGDDMSDVECSDAGSDIEEEPQQPPPSKKKTEPISKKAPVTKKASAEKENSKSVRSRSKITTRTSRATRAEDV